MNRQQWDSRKKKRDRLSRRAGLAILTLVFIALLAFGVIGFVRYFRERDEARETSERMRAVYYAAETASPAIRFTEEPLPAAKPPAARDTETSVPSALPETEAPLPFFMAETAAPVKEPEFPDWGVYPDNPQMEISTRFRVLQQENRDIAGWITIGSMLDEPVVQRDNEYYMNHDAAGHPNANGAIFLDALVSLETRPRTLILYGHNMKSGAMFGCLRNYESKTFYRNYPFITFDSLYEKGRYVVFSVCRVSVLEDVRNSLDFYALNSADAGERLRAVETLKEQSVHACTVDVQEQDQLLVLVTCVDRDDERRVVAARRIREGETETELQAQVRKSR